METNEMIKNEWCNFSPEDEKIIQKYLKDNFYSSIEDWARDSDLYEIDGIWYNSFNVEQDLNVAIYFALESAGYFNKEVENE